MDMLRRLINCHIMIIIIISIIIIIIIKPRFCLVILEYYGINFAPDKNSSCKLQYILALPSLLLLPFSLLPPGRRAASRAAEISACHFPCIVKN